MHTVFTSFSISVSMKRLFQISSKFKQNVTTKKVITNAKFDWLRLETKNHYAKQQVLQLSILKYY